MSCENKWEELKKWLHGRISEVSSMLWEIEWIDEYDEGEITGMENAFQEVLDHMNKLERAEEK
ncbi:hypothetical protein J7L00_03985 [Candidatus Bathyarchaeota archaeon]|nr:hypothetical protein [Candidatus Bathyarchaeota archaeon]